MIIYFRLDVINGVMAKSCKCTKRSAKNMSNDVNIMTTGSATMANGVYDDDNDDDDGGSNNYSAD